MKTLKVLVSIAALWSLPAWAGGYVIGNGGQGIESHGHLVLRDLVESGIESQIYIGNQVDETIKDRIDELSISKTKFPFSTDLLIRKLSDLNSAFPNLGHFILDAIDNYVWTGVDAPLAFTPDPEQILTIDPQNFVQIANRLDSTIRIDRSKWFALDDENRIALILHEAIYSLLRPVCVDKICIQKAREARTITGLLFSKSTFEDNARTVTEQVIPKLDVPIGWIDTNRIANRNWTIIWYPDGSSPFKSFMFGTALPLRNDFFMALLRKACATMRTYKIEYPGKYTFMSDMESPPYEAKFMTYETKIFSGHHGNYKEGTQLRLFLVALPQEHQEESYIYDFSTSKQSCESYLFEKYQSALMKR